MFPTLNAAYMNEALICEKKWQNEGLLNGLSRETKRDRDIRLHTAVMLENQMLANEQTSPSSTGSDDIAQFRRITIPMVRRYFPQLIAHHLVGVQPLVGPFGLVYYMRFRAGTTKGNQLGTDTTGDVKFPNPGWDATSLQQTVDGIPVVPIWYSHQKVYREGVQGANTGAAVTKSYTFGKTPVLQNSAVADPSDVADVPVLDNQAKYTAWGKIFDGAVLAGYFRVNGTTVSVTVVGAPANEPLSGTFNPSTGVLTITWNNDPGADTRLENVVYEYNLECQVDLPRITLVVESDLVEAKTRKLRADWSIEAQQDLRSQHNLDVEAELTTFLSEQVNLEIDREIINDLRNNAGTVAVWDYATALGDTIKEKYESLYVKIVEVSNQIQKKTLRSGANFVVASAEICAILESATAGFAPAPSQGFESSIGIQYVGTINNKMRIFKDPAAPADQMLLGYRGESAMDTGYFYCPYIALQQSPLLYDPESWCPRKGVLTRYATRLLREGPRYYARVSLANFFI